MVVQDYQLKDFDNKFFLVVGQCNGLICLIYENSTIVIWNPSLRELRTISTLSKGETCYVGFGYDYSIKDCKIILFPCKSIKKINNFNHQATILTLKSSPRMLNFNFPYDIDLVNSCGTLVGENIYWQCREKHILTFNIMLDTFNYFSHSCYNEDDDYFTCLSSFRGRLCMQVDTWQQNILEIIVWCVDSKERNMNHIKLWSKLFSFKLNDIEQSIHCGEINQIFIKAITKTGDVIIEIYCKYPNLNILLAAYNFEEKTCRGIELRENNSRAITICEYVETLVSIYN